MVVLDFPLLQTLKKEVFLNDFLNAQHGKTEQDVAQKS